MARRVLMTEISGGRYEWNHRGWAGWMVWRWSSATEEWRWVLCVKARKIGKSGELWYIRKWMSFTRRFFAWPCDLSDRSPVLWWLSPGEGWDAVTWGGWDKLWKGHNCCISKLRCQVYGLRGVWFIDWLIYWLCVCYLTWHDYPFLEEGKSPGILFSIVYVHFTFC